MFDFSKLGDLSKLASQAKELQEKQEHMQEEQINLLKEISRKLDAIIAFLKEK